MRLEFWVPLSLLLAADFYWSCILISTPSTHQRQCNILRGIFDKSRILTYDVTAAILSLFQAAES